MRAITVPVNASTGVAGFVFPGDHVDMVLTQQVDGGGDGPALKVSETIVRNLRVLATDQRITDKDEDGKTEVKTFSNVTLEVTPRIAEKIAVAQSIGTLSLSLRSIADNTRRARAGGRRGRRQGPGGHQPGAGAARCCSRSPTVRSTATRPSRPAATCRASSAAPFPPGPKTAPDGAWRVGKGLGQASAPPAVPTGPVVRVARGNNVTVVPVGAR